MALAVAMMRKLVHDDELRNTSMFESEAPEADLRNSQAYVSCGAVDWDGRGVSVTRPNAPISFLMLIAVGKQTMLGY
ncbi:hypothetical protein IMCC20628_02504 [Hoeflea sp. IMCC20628]|nr:hypothetical protein IMCC20628_02504 [Hoeflea sp. IMCC20628]